jgi:rhodanese-related sulfurtransferase
MSTILFIDIRNYDEVASKRLVTRDDVLYIPMNMIKFNLDYLKKVIPSYENVYIMCRSGQRSKIIKDKYFLDYDNVKVSPKQINTLSENESIVSSSSFFSLTRKIQIIAGTLILGLFILYHYSEKAIYCYLALGLFMVYVGISGNCFMSSILTKGEV